MKERFQLLSKVVIEKLNNYDYWKETIDIVI